jgi:ketosteroid isomerase-like protein
MPDDNTAVIRSLFDAFDDGDLVRAATVTDDFELTDVAAGKTFSDSDGCRQWLERFRTAGEHTNDVALVG